MPDKKRAPVPTVTAPRPMATEQSTPTQPSRIPWWVSPGGRAGQEIYNQLNSGDIIRQQDGGESSIMKPTYGGPGTDMRPAAEKFGDSDTYLEHAMNNQNTYPTIVPDTHRELMDTMIPQAARDSLDSLGEDVHDPFNKGYGDYNMDEYSMVMDKLPPGYDTPEQFLNHFLLDPNGMANDQSRNPVEDFDFYNQFTLNQAGSNEAFDPSKQSGPGEGDWFHIDIPGNDGDVMIVDTHDGEDRNSATVQTMTDDGNGKIPYWASPAGRLIQDAIGDSADPTVDHPVSGRRQFGVEHLEDGSYRFYTRGFDRQTSAAMDPQAANSAQHGDWSSLMEAMATEHGGRSEREDENGEPIWGWAQQVPADVMTSSMVRNPVMNDHTRPDAP